MNYQNISYALPQQEADAILAAINTIESKMPFLVNLEIAEIKTLFKLGPKSADFVQDAASAATSFPQILPPSFNQPEFAKDAALFKMVSDIKMRVDSLSEKLNDTLTAIGSEAMTSSLEVYAYVQTAAGGTPGLKSVQDKLKDRFKDQGKPRAKAA